MKLGSRALTGAFLLGGTSLFTTLALPGAGGLALAQAGAHQEWAWLGFVSLLSARLLAVPLDARRFGSLLGAGLLCAGAPLIASSAPLWSSPLHLLGAVALAVWLVVPAWAARRRELLPSSGLLNATLAVLVLGGV